MLKFEITADGNSREIKRVGEDPEHVGYLIWGRSHRPPYISLTEEFSHLTIEEAEACVHELRRNIQAGIADVQGMIARNKGSGT